MDDEYIYRYTRAMALADGVLIDITDIAKESGFRLPTAINVDLYAHFREEAREQDLRRLLTSFYFQTMASEKDSDMVMTEVDRRDVVLHIGGGDDGKPVLTLCYLIDL
jgi:hypothetical protein